MMSANLNNIPVDDQQRRQMLLEQRAHIDAQLASLQPSSAPSIPQYGPPSIQSSRPVHRSYSLAGTAMNRTLSGRRSEAVQMSGSLSQPCSAPSMTRTISRGTSSVNHSMPFADTGRVLARLPKVDSRRDASVIDSWAIRQDDPINAYNFAHQGSLRRSSSQLIPELEKVAEIDIGEDPKDFFARTSAITSTLTTVPISPPPIDIPSSQWRNSIHRQNSSLRRSQNFSIHTPTTPNSATLTTATTLASEMSRQSSFSNDAILGSFEMMNVHSNKSADETLFHCGIFSSSYPKLHSSNEEQALLLMGTGGASHNSHISLSYENDGASAPFTSSTVEDMERSQSKESSVSSSSSKSRATARLQRHKQLATRPIAPKAGSDENAMSRKGSLHTMVRINSREGKEERVVAAIPKTPYQRPKHDRVYCNLCSEVPVGFRGAHELGRHQDRQHKDNVKKFICVEPSDGIIYPQYRPVNPLSKCKACSHQKKKYGAYYNAAAHLRRAHFRPRPRGRSKNAKVDEKSEKRGGKGGGDWPPMAELKRWMKEVCEVVSENQAQADEEDDDDDCSGNGFDDDIMLSHMSNGPTEQSEFDVPYVYSDDTAMLDPYPTPTSTFDNQSMTNMQFEPLNQQNIDLQHNSSQSSFADSQFSSMHDDMTYIDSFPQIFEDQSLGPDLLNFQYTM